jgi:NTP pyrophosphatase (non-canonical NTP hydrolase)
VSHRINGEVQIPYRRTWEEHYCVAEKLAQDAQHIRDAGWGDKPAAEAMYRDTLAWAQFHATMAQAKVGQDQVDAWAERDREWWAEWDRKKAAS